LQVPAPFEYERATSVEEALLLLTKLGPDARLLAGEHSLLPMMKLRLASPAYPIDIDPVSATAARSRGPYRTAVGPAEMLVEIRIPWREGSGSAYETVDRRVGDWAVAAAGASITPAGAAAGFKSGVTGTGAGSRKNTGGVSWLF